jgi:hypothetical protein
VLNVRRVYSILRQTGAGQIIVNAAARSGPWLNLLRRLFSPVESEYADAATHVRGP